MYRYGRRVLRTSLAIVTLVGLAMGVVGCRMTSMPGKSYRGALPDATDIEQASQARLKRDLGVIASDIGSRSQFEVPALRKTEAYLQETLEKIGYAVERQDYQSRGVEVANLVVEVPGSTHVKEIVVVGAHYDTADGHAGANDNGTGVVGLLELARMFHGATPARTLRFVFFVNEEPPFFQTELMGSLVYARRCESQGEAVVGMLSLETMGYYSDAKGSQKYPFPFSMFYPSTGNFIGFVGDTESRPLIRQVVKSFRENVQFPSEGASIPSSISGIGWSDHWSFWQCGYPALMVTDTAPFRYPYYHTAGDTIDKIDFDRLSRVVVGLKPVIEDLVNPEVWTQP